MKLATILLSAALCWGQQPSAPCTTLTRGMTVAIDRNLWACASTGRWSKVTGIDKLAALLIKYEHHPSGGLLYVGQKGARRDAAGYARWATPELSRAGLERDLALKFARGMTVEGILRVWGGRGRRVPYAERLLKEMR